MEKKKQHTTQSVRLPHFSKCDRRLSSVVSKLSPPMKSFLSCSGSFTLRSWEKNESTRAGGRVTPPRLAPRLTLALFQLLSASPIPPDFPQNPLTTTKKYWLCLFQTGLFETSRTTGRTLFYLWWSGTTVNTAAAVRCV